LPTSVQIFHDIIIFFCPVSALNQVTLMGRVGGEPQKRGTTEHPVVVFSMATHTNYNYQAGESEIVDCRMLHKNNIVGCMLALAN